MQQDKKLQELLKQLTMEETPADFTQNIMQRIEANAAAQQHAMPLLKTRLLQALAGIFVVVLVVLLVLCFSGQPVAFPFQFSVPLPPVYISQLTSFIVVFWVVMFINQLWKRKYSL